MLIIRTRQEGELTTPRASAKADAHPSYPVLLGARRAIGEGPADQTEAATRRGRRCRASRAPRTLDAFRAALWREGVNPNPGRPYARERHLATVEK